MKSGLLKAAPFLAVLTLLPMTGCASDGDSGHGRRHQGPPPEAIKACEGMTAGDSVSFTGRRGETLKAFCQEIEGQLVAVPEGMKPRKDRPE